MAFSLNEMYLAEVGRDGGKDDLVQVWSMEDQRVVACGEGHYSWAIDKLPLIPQLFELIGLLYTGVSQDPTRFFYNRCFQLEKKKGFRFFKVLPRLLEASLSVVVPAELV